MAHDAGLNILTQAIVSARHNVRLLVVNMNDKHTAWNGRAIILLDLDAFFASVEQLDHPEWRGKPVIVGGDADKRGVVSTCSYEARAFGVRSAMPASTAAKLCPDAIWTPGNFARYAELSAAVMDIMRSKSPFLQQVSIDEAFLDISPSKFNAEDPVKVAQDIQQKVAKLGITASIGLGVSKAVAKIASDMDKPQGLTIVYPGREKDFLSQLPTKVMSGIGPVAQGVLKSFGIHTLGQVAQANEDVLKKAFGKNAEMMRLRCLGADTDPVESIDEVKSISNEMSFAVDLNDRSDIEAALATTAGKVARRLRMKKLYAGSIVLKIKYSNLSIKTTSAQLFSASNNEYDFIPVLNLLLNDIWIEGMPLRLVGCAANHLRETEDEQLRLFDDELQGSDDAHLHSKVKEQLVEATDAVRDRFGDSALLYGRELKTRKNLTGSSSKNPADYK